MSVARATEWMNRVRAAGIVVHEQSGWQTRGNGQVSAYEGWINHHTATAFANANLDILINGRPDLSGPLCNSCGWADGSVGLIAANPANHAGASGGWDTAPLPVSSLFNKRVWGHEIIYPGTVPMTPAQYRTALIVSKIGLDIWGYGDVRRDKFHQGTSITGKWDPGFAPGQTYSITKFRADALDLANPTPPPPDPQYPPMEDPMKLDATDGVNVNVTIPVPLNATKLVISQGWLPLYCYNMKYIGTPGASGSNILEVVVAGGPFPVGAARPWSVPVKAGATTVEFEYRMDYPTDPDDSTRRLTAEEYGREVIATAAFV